MGQRFQLAPKLFWKPKVHIHIWRIFFSFQIIPKYVNAAATWKIYIEMFTPTMNSVTPTGETKRCPLTFCSPASDICAAFDIFSNGCGKPFFFLSETKHQITLTNRTLPRPAGLQLGAVVSLNIYVGMVDGGGRRKQEEHIDLRCTLEKKKKNQPQSGGMRQQAEEADKRRYQPVPGPYLHTESSSRAPWRGTSLSRLPTCGNNCRDRTFPIDLCSNFPGFWRIVTHTDAPPQWIFFWWVCPDQQMQMHVGG